MQDKEQEERWHDVSKTLVENKYRLTVEKNDTAVHVIDVSKALAILREKYDLVPKRQNNENIARTQEERAD